LTREQGQWTSWLTTVKDFYKQPIRANATFCHQRHDNRPFLYVSLGSDSILALLDSGASQSILGKEGLYLLDKLGLKVDKNNNVLLQTADGANQSVIGSVLVSISLDGIVRELKLLVSESITTSLTLGADFCYLFELKTNFKRDSYTVPTVCHSSKIIQARDDLSKCDARQLEKIISQFREISGPTLGRTTAVSHRIDTGDAAPIKQRYFPMSPPLLEAMNREVDLMLAAGVIKESKSGWNSPIVMTRKRDNSLRFCFDGRRLNTVTKRDAYPLPFVNDILNQLRDAKFLSSIDLKQAFWQIPLTEDSCEKTAFTVPRRGLFEFNVLPFGLHNSPQTLQRLMDNLLGPKFENVFVYLDDIVIASSDFKEHLQTLYEVYQKLKETGLTINIEKCEFCKPSLTYLGFVIDRDGLRTDPQKVEAIVNFPTPRTSTEIKRILGMAGWYRRFIPDFSTIVAPMLDLVKGKQKRQHIRWTAEAEMAFQKLKDLLVSAPILVSPNFAEQFIIQTDASDVGLGAVLLQGEGTDERVIAYASRSLNRVERQYSATEKECAAVLFGIEKYRPFVEGTKFKIITDHYSLMWINKLQSPSGRLARWSVRISQHSFEVVHRKGKFNVVPDALSRAPLQVHSLQLTPTDLDEWYVKTSQRVQHSPEKFPLWKIENNSLYKYVPNKHCVVSNLIEWKQVIPSVRRLELLEKFHNEATAGHFGVFKTYAKLSEACYWPRMKSDVIRFIKKCPICLSSKVPSVARAGVMGKEKKVQFPFQLISVDLMGPFPRSSRGNTTLLVISDWFTKFVMVHPLRRATATSIVRFLEEQIFLIYGVPQILMCDNGPQFTSAAFKKLMDTYKVQKIWYNANYHAQVNPVERVNRVIGTALRSYVNGNHKAWDEKIHHIGHAIRTAVHEVTGYTPSFLNFARTVPVSGDYYGKLGALEPHELTLERREQLVADVNNLSEVHAEVRKKLNKAYERNRHQYNLRKRPLRFDKGSVVWKRNYVLSNAAENFAKKLAPKYVQCTVKEVTGPLTYRLINAVGKDIGVWHIKDLKPDGVQ
jgi:hypothetical protein